jgi:hypothetical protein
MPARSIFTSTGSTSLRSTASGARIDQSAGR